MLAINVQESTTTTGTGNITLAGVSEDGRTFTSQFVTNERLSYYIDDRAGNWEHGIGYLSGASTLVRETLIASSTGSAISFAAGTKQVYIGRGSDSLIKPKYRSGTRFISPTIVDPDDNASISIERTFYIPVFIDRETTFVSIGASVSAASASGIFHLALYNSKSVYSPSNRIINAPNNSSTVTGAVSVSITPITLKSGLYFFGFWSNEVSSFRGYTTNHAINTGMGVTGSNLFNSQQFQITGQTGLTELPVVADIAITQSVANTVTVFMDVQ